MIGTNQWTKKPSFRAGLRILWAITANDLLAALKNKNALMAMFAALGMALIYRFLPALSSSLDPQALLVYDAGQSVLVSLLENSQQVKVYTCASEDQLKQSLANSDVPEVGLVIPADFDQRLEENQAIPLQGYLMNWVSPADAAGQKLRVETQISRLVGRPVEVQIEGNTVYPRPDSHGLPLTVAFGLVYVILMVPLPVIPYLFLEEKQSRTLDALLVSPASARQIVAGKALSGLFYCLLCAAVALVVYWNVIVHWGLAVLAILCGSLFTVAIGLWLGLRIENRGQLSVLLWLLILPLLLPVILALTEELFPAALVRAFRLIPTASLVTLFRLSTAGDIPWMLTLLSLAWVMVWAIGMLALVTRQVRRLDRQEEGAIIQAGEPHAAQTGVRPQAWLARLLAALGVRAGAKPDALPRLAPAILISAEAQIAPTPGEIVPQPGWRIAWAIAAKDIREAVRNKIFLSVLLGTAVLAATNTFFPLLVEGQARPAYVVYDPGQSTILRGLIGREEFRLSIQDTRQEMENAVTGWNGTAVGLVLPADFDQQAGRGQEIRLQGYASHFADLEKARRWAAIFEQQLGQASWSTIRIQLDNHLLTPSLEVFGRQAMVAEVLAIILFTIGATLVPLLFIEEKEAHTLDALLVSPAGYGQVVAGKALAGAAYCLAAAVVLVGLNQRFFIHWDTILLAVLLATFFVVAVGLLIGILANNSANAGLWGSLLLVILIALTVLALLEIPGLPPFWKGVLSWLPGPAVINLFRISMAGDAPAGLLWVNAGALLAAGLLFYGLVTLRISRAGR